VKPEAGLYKRLKENLPNSHITRLESRVGLGIPDCLVALGPQQPRFVMIELKVVKGRKLAISPHQVAFHLKHADMKAPTFILVQFTRLVRRPVGMLSCGYIVETRPESWP
jgi:hypothetical protein